MRIYLHERAPVVGNRKPICYGSGNQDDEVCQDCYYLPECRRLANADIWATVEPTIRAMREQLDREDEGDIKSRLKALQNARHEPAGGERR